MSPRLIALARSAGARPVLTRVAQQPALVGEAIAAEAGTVGLIWRRFSVCDLAAGTLFLCVCVCPCLSDPTLARAFLDTHTGAYITCDMQRLRQHGWWRTTRARTLGSWKRCSSGLGWRSMGDRRRALLSPPPTTVCSSISSGSTRLTSLIALASPRLTSDQTWKDHTIKLLARD